MPGAIMRQRKLNNTMGEMGYKEEDEKNTPSNRERFVG